MLLATTSMLAVLVGLVLAVTGALQVCPINAALRIDTYRGPMAGQTTTEESPVEETRPGQSD